MQALTDDGRRMVEAAAGRHGFSTEAVTSLLISVAAGGGRQAQFNHWEFGGMGQWSQGGMIMIGDMFNNQLKYRVDALCNELSSALQQSSPFLPPPMSSQSQSQSGGSTGSSFFVPGAFANRWPAELGAPSSTGSQNNLHYAVFPSTRRLAIDQNGHISVYDIGDHAISGFSQQQGGDQSITFTSQYGVVRVADLPQVQLGLPGQDHSPSFQAPPHVEPAPAWTPPPPPSQNAPIATPPIGAGSGGSDDEIFSRIERLADLHQKGILSDDEFGAKKAELLSRL